MVLTNLSLKMVRILAYLVLPLIAFFQRNLHKSLYSYNIFCMFLQLQKNISKVSKFSHDTLVFFEFHPFSCCVTDLVAKKVLFEGTVREGLYVFDLKLQKSISGGSSYFASAYTGTISPLNKTTFVSHLADILIIGIVKQDIFPYLLSKSTIYQQYSLFMCHVRWVYKVYMDLLFKN